MALLISAGIGVAVAVILGIIGLVPFISVINCILSPLLTVAGGYFVGSTSKLKKGAWADLAKEVFVFALAGTIASLLFMILSIALGIGVSAFKGADALGLGVYAVILVIFIAAIIDFIYTFVLGAIGAL
ncbi:MAG: hypothetical protein ACPLYF_01585, partial [Fervidobacterium sp.]